MAYLDRLRRAGHGSIADTVQAEHFFYEHQKPAALDVLEFWLVTHDKESLGPELMDLRAELMRDTRHPKFVDD